MSRDEVKNTNKVNEEIYSVSKYLFYFPKDYLVAALIKSECPYLVTTKEKWDEKVKELLSRKTIY